MKEGYIYILANKKNGTLYVGVTGNLIKRVYKHKNNVIRGFTSKYKIHKLIYYEEADTMISAIQREKRMPLSCSYHATMCIVSFFPL